MTRRGLLLLASRAAGVSTAYGLMDSLGLVEKPKGVDLDALQGRGRGKGTVLVLGAGIAGMCAAYELEKLGFRCELLEARHRTGGRCVSIRRGDVVEERGERQVCQFNHGEYLNPGPTRIPYWQITIDYCRKFGLTLAPFINVNEGSYVYATRSKGLKNQRVRMRDIIADTDGYMAELVSKSVKAGQADDLLTADEKAHALDYLQRYGFLDLDGKYRGTYRRSLKDFKGAGPDPWVHESPIPFGELMTANLGPIFEFINAIDQQMTMLEIVGGVDGLAKAFQRHVRSPVRFGCQVTEIRTGSDRVTVAYRDPEGASQTAVADYCVCTIPLTVLRNVRTNFDAAARNAISTAVYGAAAKVAIQYDRRFWEEEDRIFGGISWTDQTIGQVMYPSHGFLGKEGVLVNYCFGLSAQTLGRIGAAERVKTALEQTAKIHPQAPTHFRSGVTVAWHNVPFSEGAYVIWENTPDGEAKYKTLLNPQGRLYFAGEHVSRLTAWMAGAIESARYVVNEIFATAQRSSARRLAQGANLNS